MLAPSLEAHEELLVLLTRIPTLVILGLAKTTAPVTRTMETAMDLMVEVAMDQTGKALLAPATPIPIPPQMTARATGSMMEETILLPTLAIPALAKMVAPMALMMAVTLTRKTTALTQILLIQSRMMVVKVS